MVLGEYSKRCLPEWIEYGSDDKGALGNEVVRDRAWTEVVKGNLAC
jgi:hypothetical protein